MSKLTKADAYEYKHQKIADEYELEPNPAPSPKYKALSGIPRIPNLCGATQSFLECIVELAHDHWGFAFPSRKYIQLWTGRSRWAIDRAHAKAEQLGLVATVERRIDYDHSESSLIVINWEPLFAAFERVQLLRRKDDGHVRKRAKVCAKTRKGMCESAEQSTSYLSGSYLSGSSARSALDPQNPLYENQPLESQMTTSSDTQSQKNGSQETKALSVNPFPKSNGGVDPAAMRRLYRDLDANPELADLVTPELEAIAIAAEIDSPGSGIEVIRKEVA
jgi:hypothetical protein